MVSRSAWAPRVDRRTELARWCGIVVVVLAGVETGFGHHVPDGSYGLEHYVALAPTREGISVTLDLFYGQLETYSTLRRWDANRNNTLDTNERLALLESYTEKYRNKLNLRARQSGLEWVTVPLALWGGIPGDNATNYLVHTPKQGYLFRMRWRFAGKWPTGLVERLPVSLEVDYEGRFSNRANPLYSEVVTVAPPAPDYISKSSAPTSEEIPAPADSAQVEAVPTGSVRRVLAGQFQLELGPDLASPTNQPTPARMGPENEVSPITVSRSASASETTYRERVMALFQPPIEFRTSWLALVLCFVWGVMHAFAPGHGKAIVSTYLIGTRARYLHAWVIGAVLTVTHTIVVIAVAVAALIMGDRFVYPTWLQTVGPIIIVVLGLNQIRRSILSMLAPEADHKHVHAHGLFGAHRHEHSHNGNHDHASHHDSRRGDNSASGNEGGGERAVGGVNASGSDARAAGAVRTRELVTVGLSGGLVPCPGGIVLLLLALQVNAAGLGLACLVSFSLGLAAALTLVGTLAVAGTRAVLKWVRRDAPGGSVRGLAAIQGAAGVALVILGYLLLKA